MTMFICLSVVVLTKIFSPLLKQNRKNLPDRMFLKVLKYSFLPILLSKYRLLSVLKLFAFSGH